MAKKEVNTQVIALDKDKFNKEFGKNFSEVYKMLDLSQDKLHVMTGKAVGVINKYAKGIDTPSLYFMENLLAMEPFNEYPLMIDDFISGAAVDIVGNPTPVGTKSEFVHKDMVGSYMVYLFDQSKENYTLNEKASRKLRYGVVSIVEEVKMNYGANSSFKAYAQFFKNQDDANNVHKTLTSIFDVATKGDTIDIPALAKDIETEYGKIGMDISNPQYKTYKNKEYYQGEVDFQENHVFIDLKSNYFGDHALFALYSTVKKKDSNYIGGVASLSSVSHGDSHSPCAQKALVSRYALKCSDEKIGEVIRMNPTKVSIDAKIEEIYGMFEELNKESLSGLIDRQDKLSIFANRFERIVQDYIKDGLNSVGVVTKDDDKNAYELIKSEHKYNS